MEHDITTATTGVDRDRPTAVGVVGEADADVGPAGASSHEDAEARARPSPAYISVPPDVWALARGIAAVLGETMPPPIRIITRAVDRLRPDRARAVLGQALTVEAQGGLTLPDGRRRTPGGVFFHLVRTSDAISREDKDDIFPPPSGHPKRVGGTGTPAAPAPAAPAPVAWTDATFRALARQLQQDAGRATTVKITVIGRPGAAVEQGQAVALALVNEKVPDLPKGLPEPPAGTRYTVLPGRSRGEVPHRAFSALPPPNRAGAFRRTRLSRDVFQGASRRPPTVDDVVAHATHDQRFPPSSRHTADPRGRFCLTGQPQVLQGTDVVDFNVLP